jgi:hypothetical protein
MSRFLAVCIVSAFPLAAQGAPSCELQPAGSFGGVDTSRVDNAIFFKTDGLAVDADGAPNSYLLDGNGLSYTCDGVEAVVDGKPVPTKKDPHNRLCRDAWETAQKTSNYSQVRIFGFLTGPKNVPIVQGVHDPLPGKAYVTTTTMPIAGSAPTEQRHWVDANQIPYVVLPSSFVKAFKVSPGDVAVIYNPAAKAVAFVAYADGGGLGEASVKAHIDLGSHPIVSKDGVDRASSGIEGEVLTLVFPGMHTHGSVDAKQWVSEIQTIGKEAFDKWGSVERLKECYAH